MNDGKRFFANNIELFRKRFNQSYKTTRFILLDPDAADSISVLTRKNDHEGDYYISERTGCDQTPLHLHERDHTAGG